MPSSCAAVPRMTATKSDTATAPLFTYTMPRASMASATRGEGGDVGAHDVVARRPAGVGRPQAAVVNAPA
jgi:hypothetical protein